tara:strand:+ start:1273 stop:1449 length:177 start_codon:yes stop_codon:yes gene_type:complete
MWILLWMQLASAQDIRHYHLGTFDTEKKCTEALSKAAVLVTGQNESVACLHVEKGDIQ